MVPASPSSRPRYMLSDFSCRHPIYRIIPRLNLPPFRMTNTDIPTSNCCGLSGVKGVPFLGLYLRGDVVSEKGVIYNSWPVNAKSSVSFEDANLEPRRLPAEPAETLICCTVSTTESIRDNSSLVQDSSCSNTASIRNYFYWTPRKSSVELIELFCANKASLVKIASCNNTGSIRDDPCCTTRKNSLDVSYSV